MVFIFFNFGVVCLVTSLLVLLLYGHALREFIRSDAVDPRERARGFHERYASWHQHITNVFLPSFLLASAGFVFLGITARLIYHDWGPVKPLQAEVQQWHEAYNLAIEQRNYFSDRCEELESLPVLETSSPEENLPAPPAPQPTSWPVP